MGSDIYHKRSLAQLSKFIAKCNEQENPQTGALKPFRFSLLFCVVL